MKHKKPNAAGIDPFVTELSDWTDDEGRITLSVKDLLDTLDAVYLAGMGNDQVGWPPQIEDFGVEDPALQDVVTQWSARVDAA